MASPVDRGIDRCVVGTQEVPSSAYRFDRSTREGSAYLSGIDVKLDPETNAGTDFCGWKTAMLSVVSSAGRGNREPWTAVKLETLDCGIIAVMDGKYMKGSEAVELYNRYMGQVPRDLLGEARATVWNFKQFLRGEGFGWFSDEEGKR
jgi:hypothetical protein